MGNANRLSESGALKRANRRKARKRMRDSILTYVIDPIVAELLLKELDSFCATMHTNSYHY